MRSVYSAKLWTDVTFEGKLKGKKKPSLLRITGGALIAVFGVLFLVGYLDIK